MCQLAMPLGRGVAFSMLFLELDELRKDTTGTLEPALMLGHLLSFSLGTGMWGLLRYVIRSDHFFLWKTHTHPIAV